MKRMTDERFDAVTGILTSELNHLAEELQQYIDEGHVGPAERVADVHDALAGALNELERLREVERKQLDRAAKRNAKTRLARQDTTFRTKRTH